MYSIKRRWVIEKTVVREVSVAGMVPRARSWWGVISHHPQQLLIYNKLSQLYAKSHVLRVMYCNLRIDVLVTHGELELFTRLCVNERWGLFT